MEESVIRQLWGGIQIILASVNWVFVPLFIVFMWLFNEGVHSSTTFKWLNWFKMIPQGWRVFLGGCLLAIPFAWFYDLSTKTEIASLAYAILVGMVVWKLGIENFFDWFKEHVWHAKFKPAPPPPPRKKPYKPRKPKDPSTNI